MNMKVEVRTLENKKAGEITLDASVFGVEVRSDLLHRMVNYQLAKRRAGTASTKTRDQINGTGKKPHKQKGTGSARAGDKKRPIDRGGAVVHGPKPRSFAIDMPKKVRKLALKTALSAKVAEGKLVILDEAKAKDHKTKPMAAAMEKMGFSNALILAGKEVDTNFARATANLPRIDVLPTQGANVYDILRRDTLVLTKAAVEELTEKLKGE
jgi:large subunit ribosomal protein L4